MTEKKEIEFLEKATAMLEQMNSIVINSEKQKKKEHNFRVALITIIITLTVCFTVIVCFSIFSYFQYELALTDKVYTETVELNTKDGGNIINSANKNLDINGDYEDQN